MLRLSACVIVRNEEENLPAWLENMQGLADERIVVDTGSTDHTVEIAEAAGAEVYHFTWINDFAAAKNFAIAQATGEWILFLDADETFDARTKRELRPYLEKIQGNPSVAGLITHWNNYDKDDHFRRLGSGHQVRIFRNAPDIRYTGIIHEALDDTHFRPGRVLETTDFVIRHTGYSASLVQTKVQRNLPLVEKRLAEAEARGDQATIDMMQTYFMDIYYGMQDYEKAASYARAAIDAVTPVVGQKVHQYGILISSLRMQKRPWKEIESAVCEAKEACPGYADFWEIGGFVAETQGDYDRAEKEFRTAIEMHDHPSLEESACMDTDIEAELPQVYASLGRIAEEKRDAAAAGKAYGKALSLDKYQKQAFVGWYRLNFDLSAKERWRFLEKKYDLEDAVDREFLRELLASFPKDAVYCRVAQSAPDSWERCMSRGELLKAAEAAAEKLEDIAREGTAQLAAGKDQAQWAAVLPPASLQADAPLVSILIPTYNRPAYFEQTLRSALSQDYPRFEVIVCDNSTDERTAAIAARYAADPRLTYVRNREARTKAENFAPFASLAKGEYLQWCMDDDLLAPRKLTCMAAVLRKEPGISLVTSQRAFIDADGKVTGQESFWQDAFEAQDTWRVFSGPQVAKLLLTQAANPIGEPSAVLFRRSDLEDPYFHADYEGYVTISDVAMWCALLEKGDLGVFREPMSSYRRHGAQEGQQPDTLVLSRIEWFQLNTAYRERGALGYTQADYEAACAHLIEDRRALEPVLPAARPACRELYETCFQAMKHVVEEGKETS